jgi:glycine/D-amino acid oxidase-like deaminating enzyme
MTNSDVNAAPQHPATWYAQTAVAAREWPALTFDLDTDVCGRRRARGDYDCARNSAARVVGGADRSRADSRRSIRPQHRLRVARIWPRRAPSGERCDLDHAKALWALSEEGVAYVRNTILGLAMPGVDPADGWLSVSTHNNADQVMRTLTLLAQGFGAEVEGWPVERVREALRSDCYFHGLHFPKAFHIHPLNYALGLAADAERRGARLFEQTRALEMDPLGVRKRITTPSAKIRANHIVLAGNVNLGGIARDLAATVLPMTTYVAVTQPVGYLTEAVAFTGAVSDSRGVDHQYRIVDWDRLMWSAGATAWAGDPRRYGDRIKASIARVYPRLRGVEIAHVWSGTMGFAVHRMPQIGEIAPGLWVASAFGSHGINTTAIAGELIARALVDHDDAWRLFLPYDLVWAGGRLGRTVLQANVWARRGGDRVRAGLARKRRAAAQVGESVPATQPDA